MMKSHTLSLTGWSGKTILLTILFTLAYFGIIEGVVRLDIFQAPLSTPTLGSGHYQLGQKLAFLDRTVRRGEPIDCIMIGSSMVDVGFDPSAFQKGYQEIKGQRINCFNFGVDASSAVSTHAIARIVMEDYHPRLLIVGTDARDYVLPRNDSDVSVVMNTPWIQYRLGNFSFDGWLTDISYFYRYRQHLGRLMRFNYKDTLLTETFYNFEILPNGYTPINKVSTYSNDPPNLKDDSYEVQYYSRIFASYEMLDLNLDAMGQTLAFDESEHRILVVEMPVPDGYYYFFGNGDEDHKQFVKTVNALADQNQVPFWQTETMDMIPDDGWSGYSHMNTTGAELFSAWLGRQVAQAETNGTLASTDN